MINTNKKETAILAGGCFWCMVQPFDQWDGIEQVISGYTGGHQANPTYQEVCDGHTGHTEAVEITFDPKIISYDEILDIYWQISDPTDLGGQFSDRGSSYRPEIFYTTESQKIKAEKSKQKLAKEQPAHQPILTPITKATKFWPAEDYHQDFYKKNPAHYTNYRQRSGRDNDSKNI